MLSPLPLEEDSTPNAAAIESSHDPRETVSNLPDMTLDVHQHSWHFIDDPTEDNFCSLCKNILKEPMLTACCGVHLCKVCAEPSMTGNELFSCPICVQCSALCILNKAKWKNILQLEVRCPIRESGCEWTGSIQETQNHLSQECKYRDSDCSNKCGRRLKRHEITEHLEKFCPRRQVTCIYCKKKGEAEIITGDHISKCSDFLIDCPNGCGKQIKRAHSEQHLEECPQATLSCPYKFSGCDVTLTRDLMPHHFLNSMLLHSQIQSRYVIAKLEQTSHEFHEQKEVSNRMHEYYNELKQLNMAELKEINKFCMKQTTLVNEQKEQRLKKINQKITELRFKLAQPHEHLEHTVKRLVFRLPNMLWEIDRASLQFENKIASEQFAEVWKGVHCGDRQVAIKKHRSGSMTSSKFLAEAILLKQLEHSSIIKLMGVSSKEGPTLIVTEFMISGSLFHFLKTEDSLSSERYRQLQVDIIEQIASGMAYLESINCVHRALNSRSILVGENLRCKISSFSLARMLEKNEYEYIMPHGERAPIKWSAPEVLNHNKCSTKSDVWSFGMLQYEIITRKGLKMSNTKAEALIKDGSIPKSLSPVGCPTEHFDRILHCLHFNPDSRPTFCSLVDWMDYYFGEIFPVL